MTSFALIARLVVALALVPAAFARHVDVEVTAPWTRYSTGILPQLGEFLRHLSPKDSAPVWAFVDNLCANSALVDSFLANTTTAESFQAHVVQSFDRLVPATFRSLAETMLGIGFYAPMVPFHASLSELHGSPCNGQAFTVVYPRGSVVCDASQFHPRAFLPEHAQDPSGIVQASDDDWDLVMHGAGQGVSAELYGVWGSTSFCSQFSALRSLLQNDPHLTRVSVRHSFDGVRVESEDTSLQGFGVFLDIKNMEYKNMDDSVANSAEEADSSTLEGFAEDSEVLGVNFHRLLKNGAADEPRLRDLRAALVESEATLEGGLKPVQLWKLRDLGLQMVHYLETRGVDAFVSAVQSLPAHLSAISALRPRDLGELREAAEVWQAQSPLTPGLYVNNRRVEIAGSTFNVFDVLQTVFEEIQRVEELRALPFPRRTTRQLLDDALGVSTGQGQGEEDEDVEARLSSLRVDVARGSKGVVHFLNNLEKDALYRGWSRTLRTLLTPSWGLPALARNLFTVVVVVDVTSAQGATLLLQELALWQQHSLPVRLAFVLDTRAADPAERRLQEAAALLFLERLERDGLESAVDLLAGLAEAVLASLPEAVDERGTSPPLPLTVEDVLSGRAFEDVARPAARQAALQQARTYLQETNLPSNCVLLNGRVLVEVGAELHSQAFYQALGREHAFVRGLVHGGVLKDSSRSLFADILKAAQTVPRYLPALFEGDGLAEGGRGGAGGRRLDVGSAQAREVLAAHVSFLSPAEAEAEADETASLALVFLDASLASVEAAEQLVHWTRRGAARLAVVFMSEVSEADPPSWLLPLLPHALASAWGDDIHGAAFCRQACADTLAASLSALRRAGETPRSAVDILLDLGHPVGAQVLRDLLDHPAEAVHRAHVQCTRLGALLSPGMRPSRDTAVLALNARVWPVAMQSLEADVALVWQVLRHSDRRVQRLLPSLTSSGPFARLQALAVVTHFRAQHPGPSVEAVLHALSAQTASVARLRFDLEPRLEEDGVPGARAADVSLALVLDPLHPRGGPRGAALLALLRDLLHQPVTLVLAVPRETASDPPPQSFYAFAMASRPLFPRPSLSSPEGTQSSASSSSSSSPAAALRLRALPRAHVLTARADVPEPWNVQAKAARQDLDNLRCVDGLCGEEAGGAGTRIGYTLQTLLVPGQCFETRRLPPPRGLQLGLYDARGDKCGDTLVMQNLGYFQLQSPRPGLARIALEAGRSAELYDILGEGAEDGAGQVQPHRVVAVTSFCDTVHRVRVRKRPGMEDRSLLDPSPASRRQTAAPAAAASRSVWSSLASSLFGRGDTPASADTDTVPALTQGEASDETLHVFSLATGQMYERLLRIMMLSVHKHTRRRLKFWLFENYLSPAFKALAAAMAARYGFEVAYVTYKWPQWLRAQTVQQRIIWGYKILFLDVLFPLDVHKIIYVDADQVVRSDLAELYDLDLHGAPYAYTPFCTSREETLGFQFWRSGYWKDHLQGRPYHISALYVVDLDRFREMAVGDILRSIYDNLSRDPNSLANLDQDLPNYAQHQVPIFSLPQEWLWCETWCSDGSKAQAKTIDLCNNPLHKEPKLDMARRVISGPLFNQSWVELDEEIKDLARRHGLVHAT